MSRIIELDKQKECMSWGIQGESGATTLVVDIGDFRAVNSNGTAAVIFQRQDGHPYIHNFTMDEENLFITLTSIDTQLIGKCEVSISWVSGSKILKKKNYKSFILPAALEGDLPLTEEAIVALDNLEKYVEEAKDLLEQVEQYSQEIIFVDTLPAVGENGKLYIDKNTNKLYFWNGTSFVLMIGGTTSGPSFIDYDWVHGGDANETYDSMMSGGTADHIEN